MLNFDCSVDVDGWDSWRVGGMLVVVVGGMLESDPSTLAIEAGLKGLYAGDWSVCWVAFLLVDAFAAFSAATC
jgi:hypothetical protein